MKATHDIDVILLLEIDYVTLDVLSFRFKNLNRMIIFEYLMSI